MGLHNIKKVGLITLCLMAFSAVAGDITPGYTPVDGQRLSAANLTQLVGQARINPTFYTSQVSAGTNLVSSDVLLVYSPASQTFHKITGAEILNNPSIFINPPLNTTIPPYGTIVYYNPTNQTLYQIVLTNLARDISSNLVVSNFVMATTNGQSLAAYTNTPNFFATNVAGTNLQTETMIWDTNGIPYYITYSNFLAPFVAVVGTNQLVPYIYTNMFLPWTIYPTNTTTNAWGYYTNFPITNLYFTNSVVTNPTVPTIVDSDRFPIVAASQGTNTTATLLAFYQYLTNKNALPAYALARAQFGGIPAQVTVTNVNQSQHTFQATGNGLTGINGISFLFAGAAATTLPTTPQLISNRVYYASPTGSNAAFVMLYTNYADALIPANEVVPTGAASTSAADNKMLVLTNFTRYNADPIALCTAGFLRTGVYDLTFRTNLTTTNYYVTGTASENVGGFVSTIAIGVDGIYATNRTRFETIAASTTPLQPFHVLILVQPE